MRERPEDIPLLVDHFLHKQAGKLGRKGATFTAEAQKALMAHQWPDNVRELENTVERSLIICDGDLIDLPCLPETIRGRELPAPQVLLDGGSLSIKRAEETIERELVRRALERTGGNRTHAARLLEISLRALLYKIKEFGLE